MTKNNDNVLRPGDPCPYRFWLNLWPLGAFLAALAAASHWIWLRWPQTLLQMLHWQKQLHQHMVVLLQEVQAKPQHYGATLLLFSFVYGILHAVGPGHGKVVITIYLATHRSRLRQSLLMTLAAALLQGTMAVMLVTVTLNLLRLSSRTLHLGQFWLEKASFVLVAGLGVGCDGVHSEVCYISCARPRRLREGRWCFGRYRRRVTTTLQTVAAITVIYYRGMRSCRRPTAGTIAPPWSLLWACVLAPARSWCCCSPK